MAPILLREAFELLLSIYAIDHAGQDIITLLREDWGLFPDSDIAQSEAQVLLGDILGDGNYARSSFSPKEVSDTGTLEKWRALDQELKHRNRFFPEIELDLDVLENLLSYLLLDRSDIQNTWYRARIQSGTRYSESEMGAPPRDIAGHGRANPAGIPYLYIASEEATAVTEVRPHPGERITIGDFHLGQELTFVDVRSPKKTISPFIPGDEDSVAQLRNEIGLLEHFGKELTKPIIPRSAAIDYIPSQYLCEFAKKRGYDGVMYKSSSGIGENLALFDPGKANCMSTREHLVTGVRVESEENDS